MLLEFQYSIYKIRTISGLFQTLFETEHMHRNIVTSVSVCTIHMHSVSILINLN